MQDPLDQRPERRRRPVLNKLDFYEEKCFGGIKFLLDSGTHWLIDDANYSLLRRLSIL